MTKGQLSGKDRRFPKQGRPALVFGSEVTDSDSSFRRDLGIVFSTHSLEISVELYGLLEMTECIWGHWGWDTVIRASPYQAGFSPYRQ